MVVYEWFQGFATECMQFVNGTVLEWFVFLVTIYWMNMSWMCTIRISMRWIVTCWLKERTFCTWDSYPFSNNVHSIFCYIWLWYRKLYKKEWKWMGMWLVVISKSDSISVIHNWKWMSNPANIVLKWVWTVIRHMLYIRRNHWCWQNRVINIVDQ